MSDPIEYNLTGSEITPGLGLVNTNSTHNTDPDYPVYLWTVPSGVSSVSFTVLGGVGGYRSSSPSLSDLPLMVRARNLAVSAGDVFRLEPGGEATSFGNNYQEPSEPGSPLSGGYGSQDGDGTLYSGTWYGGAGGGASRLSLNGEVLAISGGGGGWATIAWPSSDAPTNGLPTSGGTPGIGGDAAPGSGGGGGGGGAPAGAAGGAHQPGENGGSILPPSEDLGGPQSPTWDEDIWFVDFSSTHGRGGGGIRIYYFWPFTGKWSIDNIRF